MLGSVLFSIYINNIRIPYDHRVSNDLCANYTVVMAKFRNKRISQKFTTKTISTWLKSTSGHVHSKWTLQNSKPPPSIEIQIPTTKDLLQPSTHSAFQQATHFPLYHPGWWPQLSPTAKANQDGIYCVHVILLMIFKIKTFRPSCNVNFFKILSLMRKPSTYKTIYLYQWHMLLSIKRVFD